MRNTFKVLFYIKKNALLRNGNAPIMGRITINGQRTQFSTRLSVAYQLWDVAQGRAIGRGAAITQINEQLSSIRHHIETCYNRLFYNQVLITPQMVKEMYFGVDQRAEMLLNFFRLHNEEFQHLVGVCRSKATYLKYRCVYAHLERFVQNKYNRKDIMFKELDKEFIAGFHAYIVQECSCKKNTTWIYMIALKHIFMLAHSRGYLGRDLFANYKLHSEFVDRNYLSISEISKMMSLETDNKTLEFVRDAYLFSCFTGLSYIDLRELTLRNIRQEKNQVWISTTRRKTGSEVNVRVFSVAQAILTKYAPKEANELIFNMPSNSWCNACLNKITTMVGIAKRITFHTARHTFATTITLSQGVAIETISKLLGHRNIKTTQIYATITHARLDSEMERLSKRIDSLYEKPDPGIKSET